MIHVWPTAAVPADLPSDDAHVWAVTLKKQPPTSELSAILSSDECQRAERFRFDEPRRRFIQSRAALRTILGAYLVNEPAEIVFQYDANGKPRIEDAENTTGLRFNLAQSDELALVAVVRGCEVGVDVERLRAVSHMEQIARRYFHQAEADEILGSAPATRLGVFLSCWTAKEAVLKAIGTGLGNSLSAFQAPIANFDGDWVNLPAAAIPVPARCWLQQLSPCNDYVAAVAFVGCKRRVECFSFDRTINA
jgi:4'-phosphopantetheinyl transferase